TNITSVFNPPSSSIASTSFPNPSPFNINPPSTSTPPGLFTWPRQPLIPNESGNSVPNTPFPTLTPAPNPTPPPFNQASSNENPFSLNPAQPSTSTPSSTTSWLFTQPSTFKEIGKSQINPAPSSWTSHTFPGNQGGSTDKVVDCIIAVKDPFGSHSVSSHPLTDHCICSPLIQNGISYMPVSDFLQVPIYLHMKYNPKSDEPKVAFFDHTDGIPNTQKECNFILPRENPRSVFEATSKLSSISISCAKVDVTDASTLRHDGGLESKNDQANSSVPCNLECKKPANEKRQQMDPSVPKLHRPDYYTQPSIQELRSAESYDPGFCSHVKDFVLGRHEYGQVKFEGETDVRGLDLDALVYFNKREVIVYEDEHEKPEIGEGLNKRAEVTLLHVKCSDKTGKEYKSGKMVDKFAEKLKKVAENQGAEFVSYDGVTGVWKFQVQHF
ncbi:hypothetical protein KSS87_020335, partial [Heliosperma pusillum]